MQRQLLTQQLDFGTLEHIASPKFAGSQLGDIIAGLIPYIFVIAGLLLLLYLIYGGFHYMVSLGDPKGMQEARGKITNALAGFLIVFLAYWLVQIAGTLLGLDGFKGVF